MRENNKRRLVCAALAALLLTGCATPAPPAESTQPTVPPATVTVPTETTLPAEPGLYIPDSPVERATDGAVKLYQFDGSVTGLAVLGENLAICTDGNTLRLYEIAEMTQIKERPLDPPLSWADESLVLTLSGIAWYDDAHQDAYIILDENLVNTATVTVDKALACKPIISADFATIYYADHEGIKAMDLSSGASRMLRQESGDVTALKGVLLGGTLLHYTRAMADGSEQSCFIRTSDGSICYAGPFRGELVTDEDKLSGVMTLDHPMSRQSWVIRHAGELTELLTRARDLDHVIPLDGGHVLVQSLDQMGLHLDLYSLDSNTYSAVMLPQFTEYFAYAAYSGGKLWLCDGIGGKFYCWDTAMTPADKLERPLIVAQADTGELSSIVTDRAAALSNEFGVEITLDAGADRSESGYPAYQDGLFALALEQLEEELQRTPTEFWAAVGKTTDSGRLQIVLTDSYDPASGTGGNDGSFSMEDGEAVLTLSICQEMAELLYRELWNVMEVRIRNRSDRLNSWSQLNPDGFIYCEDPAQWESGALERSEYLIPGKNWFADSYAMVSARNDRIQTFLYAAIDGNAGLYQSDSMQEKLAMLCDLVRSAYKLNDELVLPWEQYLEAEEAAE